MKVPIPSDWDGETWECFQVQWPKSDSWRGVLLGLLSYPMRGRFWDDRTGIVKDVQSVAWEIWERDLPLLPCVRCDDSDDGGDSPSQPGIAQVVGNGDGLDEEDDDMTGVSWLSIEDGVLYMYFGPCCKIAVGSFSDFSEGEITLPDDPLNPDDDPNMVYSACGKAYAIVEMIYLVADAVWENSLSLPWQWVGIVEDAIPGNNDLDDTQIINAFLVADILRGLQYTSGDIFDPVDKQQLLCKVESLLADDAEGITRPQWDSMIGAIGAIYGEVVNDFFRNCADAIGPSDMRELTKLAATDTTQDCGCPQVIEPTGNVYFRGDFIQTGQPDDKCVVEVLSISDDALTITAKMTRESGQTGAFVGARGYFPLVVLQQVKRIRFEITGVPPYKDWTDVAVPPVDWTHVHALATWSNVVGITSTTYNRIAEGPSSLIAEHVYTNLGIPSGVGSSDNLRMPGGTVAEGSPTEIEFSIHIVSYDVV